MPVIFKYDSPYLDLENSVIHFFAHTLLCATNHYTFLIIKELPVFKPNEYFFEHHTKEGEERWETYARVIRDIMADSSGLKTSE